MATFSKEHLTGGALGVGIVVAATSSAGTPIHTVPSSVTDEIYLYAANFDTVTKTLTIEFGGTTEAGDHIVVGIPSKSGLTLVVPGLALGAGKVVKAFTDSPGSKVNIFGFVNRIT